MASPTDRIAALVAQDETFTGLDFVQVIRPATEVEPCDPFTLRIYFHTDVRELDRPFTDQGDPSAVVELTLESIVIEEANGDPHVPNVRVVPGSSLVFGFEAESCRSFLDVEVESPRDFRRYRLRVDDPITTVDPTVDFSRIDPFFNDIEFTFEVGCEDNLDCKTPELVCPEEPRVDFPVDYLARDFVSLRNALLDFAAQRYPEWTLPIEADVGSMLMEIFAALGDEFSYVQDRHAREAFLETATERRSLRKKARLLDYDIHDGRSATTLLEVRVAAGAGLSNAPTGTPVLAASASGPPVTFEVGLGLRDPKAGYPVHDLWNAGSLIPYWPERARQCLEIGATELLIEGEIAEFDTLEAAVKDGDRLMLLRTDPADPSVPRRRHFVHLTTVEHAVDPLFGQELTRLRWDESDALPFQIDQALLTPTLNIVPAVAGEHRGKDVKVEFVCGPSAPTPAEQLAVERQGPLPLSGDDGERPTIFLFSLPGTDTGGLGFLGPSLREAEPEILLREKDTGVTWDYFRSLLEADADKEAFTLEDGTWRRVLGFFRDGEEIVHQDYASGAGYTLRLGDGTFGKVPARGTVFELEYRLGPGAVANVSPDTVTSFDAALLPFVESITNPWPIKDGADAESASDIKLLTPEAYRAETFFAVRPEDYGRLAERLPFVQRGQGTFRWTGSWSTVFVAADPVGSFTLSDAERVSLEDWMDCVRQAGRDVIVKDPRFRTLDLEITICVEPFAYAGQVVERVTEALLGRRGPRPLKGFFHPDNFTFGTPLRRSALEAAIQSVPGVRAVLTIRKRERGLLPFQPVDELIVEVAPDEVFRLENDPTHPERGSLRIITEGGA